MLVTLMNEPTFIGFYLIKLTKLIIRVKLYSCSINNNFNVEIFEHINYIASYIQYACYEYC